MSRLRVICSCVLLLAFASQDSAIGEQPGLLEKWMTCEFPEPAELSPQYPGPDDNEIARFRVQLHKDIGGLFVSTPPVDDREILDAYLDLRNRWMESDSLTKCILAGAITMAIDEYLNRAVNQYPSFSQEQQKSYYSLVLRNNLTGKAWFGAIDRTLQESGSPHKPLLELCEDVKVMPREPCWEAYVKQFGMSCVRFEMEQSTVAFLDVPSGQTQHPFARVGMFEDIARNPVFILHMNEPAYVIQFAARVLDENRIRQIVWLQAVNRKPDLNKKERTLELTNRLNTFAPAGARWLAFETYSQDGEINLEFFRRKLTPGSSERSYLKPIEVGDAAYYRELMTMVRNP